MMSASCPRSRKYSPMVHPEYGAMYCIAADSDAEAATTIVYAIAPFSSSFFTTFMIDDATDQLGPDRDFEDASRAFDGIAFGDVLVIAEDHRADRVALEIERQTERVVRELDHFALHRIRQPMHPRDAVGERHYGTLSPDFRAGVQVLDLALDEFTDFRWIQLHDLSSCSFRLTAA